MHSGGYSGSSYFRAGSASREPSATRKPAASIGLSLPSYSLSRSHSLNTNGGAAVSNYPSSYGGSYSSLGATHLGSGSGYSGSHASASRTNSYPSSSVGRSGSFSERDYGYPSAPSVGGYGSSAYSRSGSATRAGYSVPSSPAYTGTMSFSIPTTYGSSVGSSRTSTAQMRLDPSTYSTRSQYVSPAASPRLASSSLASYRLSSRYSDYGSMNSLSDRASSRPSRPASTSSSLAGDSVPPSGRTTPSPSEVLPQNEELDYKKLYEEQKTENGRLRDQMQETKNELTDAKAKLERSVQVSNARTALSEVEKRERRALERKLSEMEEELKQLQKLKAENEKLKAENRALTRVVTKLTATGGQATS